MKKLVVMLAVAMMVAGMRANAYDEYQQPVSPYYTSGVQYLKSHQYTNAITELKKALRENPNDTSARIQLINAYLARAAYFNNQAKQYNKSANDLRSGLFYMKYYSTSPIDTAMMSNIQATENNLNIVMSSVDSDNSPKARFERGKTLRSQGEFAAAAIEYHAAQLDTSYKKDASIALGDIYYILNLNEQAANFYEQAIKCDASNVETHLKLARVYERLGQTDKAINEYNCALTKSDENQDILLSLETIWRQKVADEPENAEAHANLGAVLQKKGDFVNALTEYQTAEKINPTNVTTRMNLGTLYQQQNNFEAAIQAYDSILRLYPNNKMAYYYKAQCLKAQGLKDAAIQNYKLALNLDTNDENIKNELFDMYKQTMTTDELLNYMYTELQKTPADPLATYNYAYELHKAGKLDDAITYYKQSIKLNPNYPNAYINLAQVYRQKSDYNAAKQILVDAKSLFPENGDIKKHLASVEAETGSIMYSDAAKLYQQQKYNEAIAIYNKIQPATVESNLGLGACYQALNNYQTAIEYFKKAFALDSTNADTAYYIGLAYSNLDDYANAKTYANKALALDKNNKNAKDLLNYTIEQENIALLDKAMGFYEKKQLPQALELINKALAQDSTDANAYYYRALVYDEQKKYNEAIADYGNALKNNPEMTIVYYAMAIDYDYLKQYKNALLNYKKFLASTKEQNEYTKYSEQRVKDLHQYDTP